MTLLSQQAQNETDILIDQIDEAEKEVAATQATLKRMKRMAKQHKKTTTEILGGFQGYEQLRAARYSYEQLVTSQGRFQRFSVTLQ